MANAAANPILIGRIVASVIKRAPKNTVDLDKKMLVKKSQLTELKSKTAILLKRRAGKANVLTNLLMPNIWVLLMI